MTLKKIKVDLRPHNKKSYKASKKMFETQDRVCFVQATGTGKSYVILQFLEDYKKVNKLLVAPSNDILNQFRNNNQIDIQNTTFITYQKLLFLYNKNEMNILGDLKFICLDEMHRAGAKRWELAVKELLDLNPDANLLGATATPIRNMDSKDMTKELFNKNCSYELTLIDALMQKILPVPKYISALYDIEGDIDKKEIKLNAIENPDKQVQKLLNDLKNLRIELCTTLSVENILKDHLSETVEENSGAKVLVFCNDVKSLKDSEIKIKKWFSDAFDLPIEISTYHYKDKIGYKNFEKFKNSNKEGSIKLLLSIEKLNEGVHIDDIDSIVMLRKTTSNIIYHQQLGRALSISGSKKPIVFDLVNNYNNVGNSISFFENLKDENKKHNESINPKDKKDQSIIIDFHDYIHDTIKTFEQIDNRLCCHWTEEQIKELRKYYPTQNNKNLNKIINKTIPAIKYKAKELDLKKQCFWSNEQIEELKKYYLIENNEELEKRFNRKIKNISIKANSLGLKKINIWSKEDLIDLKKYYLIESNKELEKRFNRKFSEITKKANLLGFKNKLFWTDKQIKELKKYYLIENNEQLEKRFGREIRKIRSKARYLGLKRVSLWTEEEVLDLKKYYSIESSKELEKRFSRPINCIRTKANKLGIKKSKSKKFTKEEDKLIMSNLKIKELVKLMPDRKKDSIYGRIALLKSKMNLSNKD